MFLKKEFKLTLLANESKFFIQYNLIFRENLVTNNQIMEGPLRKVEYEP